MLLRTSQRLSRGSVKGGPAKLVLRARERLQLSERDRPRVDQQTRWLGPKQERTARARPRSRLTCRSRA